MSEPQWDKDEDSAPGNNATTENLKTLDPDTQSLATSNYMSPKDEGGAGDDSKRTRYAVGEIFVGMELKSIHEPVKGSSVLDDAVESKGPSIDVVHVVGAIPSQHKLLSLAKIASMIDGGLEKRELLFYASMEKLLNEDIEFTRINVEAEAHRLISALKHFQHSDAEAAYDVGALVLQKAISLVSQENMGEPGIFTDTARFVSCGCFQRAENDQTMGIRIFKFLDFTKDNNQMWLEYLTLTAAQNLACVSREAGASFLRSKFALRSRLISLHAGPTDGQIHETFDRFTATLGLATELAIEEVYTEETGSTFPQLHTQLLPTVQALDRWQVALESTLMSITPQPAQMLSRSPSLEHPILSSEAYHTWASKSGTQILLINGPDRVANVEAAEQVGFDWVRRQPWSERNVFSFDFDARNPLRNSIASFLTASMLYSLSQGSFSGSNRNILISIFKDQLEVQNAWLDEDIVNLAWVTSVFESEDTPTLLLGLDECDADERETLWALIGKSASNSEETAKFVVTTNKPGTICQRELREWPDICLLEFSTISNEDLKPVNQCEDDIDGYWITRLCPKGMGRPELSEALQRLRSMDREVLDKILRLLEAYSRWPATPSSANLALFGSLVQNVSPTSTLGSIADSILQSLPDQGWLQWLLSWAHFAQRPLTLFELSTLLFYCTKTPTGSFCLPDDEDLLCSWNEIDHQLRGFLEINEGSIHISGTVLEILNESQPELWKMARKTAPERTANFLLDFLGSQEAQEKLECLCRQYEGKLERSQGVLTPPLGSDGRDAIFYAIQALPYHLSGIKITEKTRKSMCDPKGPYMSWSKAYWAMSNPFSRPAKGPLPSAWSTWETSPESGPSYIVKTGPANDESASKDEGGRNSDHSMENLIAAVKANKEDLSMAFAAQVLIDLEADGQNVPEVCRKDHTRQVVWPASILWRATWLDMNRLLEFLLDNGIPVDDSSSVYTPSPLYLATHFGNSEAVSMLIERGADFRITNYAGRNPLQSASTRGHPDVVKLLLEKDSSMLEEPHPCRPLFAAATWGCWKVVKLLLENGANTERPREPVMPSEATRANLNREEDWTPLTAAISQGFTKTARILLEDGAGPNMEAPWGKRVPLYFAAVQCGSVELVRLLLEHKADPNDSRLVPPILTAIIEGAQLRDETKMEIFNALLHGHKPVTIDEPDAYGRTALMAAAMREDMTAIQFLLKSGADVNAVDSKNQHSLFWAVLEGKTLAVKALLGHSVKPCLDLTNSWGEFLLPAALRKDGLLQILVEAGADLTYTNEQQQTILNVAAAKGNREVVEYLLSLGCDKNVDIDHRDHLGYTPIIYAAAYKQDTEVVRLLMENGACLSDRTTYGSGPLHLAAANAQPDMLRVLLEYHSHEDIDMRDNWEDTPLLSVGMLPDSSALECIQLLVRAGANINATNKNGWTLLMRVSSCGQELEDVYNYVLSRPDVNIKSTTNTGITALHLASSSGLAALVTKLLEHGADANARAFVLNSTPLIAACRPADARNSDTSDTAVALENMDRIVRDLVSHGAAVQATVGISLFSPLAAASLYASVGTINYLLDKSASSREPDPLGRLPIHFAAANGIRNFEALALVHDDNIMVSDRFSKNALHWASEFGHVRVLRAILDRVSPKERKDHINAGDIDGWTPLAWACRPTSADVGSYWILSEKPDYPATIQCLLDHGADKSISFQVGGDDEIVENFTPWKMARRCGLNDDVLSLLEIKGTTSNKSIKASHDDTGNALLVETKKYRQISANCDFCFSQIWGILWTCQSCEEGQYVLCKKCFPRGHIEHQRTVNDHREGQEHSFHILEEDKEEFESPPSTKTSVKAQSVVGSGPGNVNEQEGAGDQRKEARKESTAGLDDLRYEVDDMVELEFPDLDELDQLDDVM